MGSLCPYASYTLLSAGIMLLHMQEAQFLHLWEEKGKVQEIFLPFLFLPPCVGTMIPTPAGRKNKSVRNIPAHYYFFLHVLEPLLLHLREDKKKYSCTM